MGIERCPGQRRPCGLGVLHEVAAARVVGLPKATLFFPEDAAMSPMKIAAILSLHALEHSECCDGRGAGRASFVLMTHGWRPRSVLRASGAAIADTGAVTWACWASIARGWFR